MTELKKIFMKMGLNPAKAADLSGMPKVTIAFHYYGRRRISAQSALIYEKTLHIPRWELRPDLWDKPCDA